MAHAIVLICACLVAGCFFSMEHPKASKAWRLPFFVFLISLAGIYVVELDQWAHGKRPGDWDASQGDVRVKKPTWILTNNPFVLFLARRCPDAPVHNHQIVFGNSGNGKHRSLEARSYPRDLAIQYAACQRSAWVKGLRPKPWPWFPRLTLAQCEANLAIQPGAHCAVPDEVKHGNKSGRELDENLMVPIRAQGGSSSSKGPSGGAVAPPAAPSTEGGASSSSSGPGLPSSIPHVPNETTLLPDLPDTDYWMQTDKSWVRVHMVPRLRFFDPRAEGTTGPDIDTIGKSRVTQMVYTVDGTSDTKRHMWDDPHWAVAKTRRRWVGRSVFPKEI